MVWSQIFRKSGISLDTGAPHTPLELWFAPLGWEAQVSSVTELNISEKAEVNTASCILPKLSTFMFHFILTFKVYFIANVTETEVAGSCQTMLWYRMPSWWNQMLWNTLPPEPRHLHEFKTTIVRRIASQSNTKPLGDYFCSINSACLFTWSCQPRDSQHFSDHVPVQHFDRWACAPKILMTKMLSKITKIHWIFHRTFGFLEL